MRLGVVLTGAMVASTFMQFSIGALGPAIRGDLGVSRAAIGTLSAAYYLVAALLSRPIGRRIDSVPARTTLVALFGAAAIAMAAAALADSYGLLLLAVVPAGASAAAGNPVTNRIVAHLAGRRGTLVAVKQSGVQFGALAAGAVLPPLALAIGWHGALACLGGVCAAAIAMVAWAPALPASPAVGHGRDHPTATARGVRVIAVYAFFMGAGMSTVTAYLPLYGHDRLGLPQATAGTLVGIVGAAGVVSRLWWTRLHERRSGAGGSSTILAGLAAGALLATVTVVVAAQAGSWLLWVGAALLGLTATAWNALAMLAVVERTPAASAAATSGIVLTAFYLGLCVASPAYGLVVDAVGDYAAGWALTAACFAAAAVAVRARAHALASD